MNTVTTDEKKPPRHERTREFRVKLTPDEEREYGQKLAAGRAERRALDDKRKAVSKDYGGQLAQIDAELDRLTSAIRDKEELRPVRVYEEWHAGVIEIRRVDNDEVIDTRLPTISEQQASFGGPYDDEVLPPEPGIDEPEGVSPVAEDDDFGGQQSRKAAKLELVTSATGGEVAHMPDDDESEVPVADGDVESPKPASKSKKSGARKGKAKR